MTLQGGGSRASCSEERDTERACAYSRRAQENLGTWECHELLKAGGDIKTENMRID